MRERDIMKMEVESARATGIHLRAALYCDEFRFSSLSICPVTPAFCGGKLRF